MGPYDKSPTTVFGFPNFLKRTLAGPHSRARACALDFKGSARLSAQNFFEDGILRKEDPEDVGPRPTHKALLNNDSRLHPSLASWSILGFLL